MGARRRSAGVAALAVLLAVALPAVGLDPADPAEAAAATSVTIDGTSGGRTFDGIGAVSGGGGNTRLLVDYPEPYRGQILDYLFKPGYGASLQLLKVEVGGDTNSTDGAEPSHKHTRSDLNCDRGYEWWLMEQAKARNPNIRLGALAWGAPGWIGGGNFWSQDMIDYLVAWLDCAKSHNLTIHDIGGWNEKGYDKAWFVKLDQALAANHSTVKIVADDGNKGWLVADDIVTDTAFAKAVDVLGIHYSCGYQGTDKGKTCLTTANSIKSGKQLWASETGSQDHNTGVFAMARSHNRGYLDARMTGYINWPVIAALYPNLPWSTTGLLVANSPWSGAYRVGKNTWGTAHTTQFTAPGWRYLDSASGFFGGNRNNGSYVTLKSPNNRDYSTIIETIDAPAAQTVDFTVTGGLSTGAVHVWATNPTSNDGADHFVRQADVRPVGGRFSITVRPGYLYSLTTTTGQGKGTAAGPAAHGLPLPHADAFERYGVGKEATYLSDMDGSFEVVNCGAGRSGKCVRQMAPVQPIVWRNGKRDPSALLGDAGWTDYTLRTDVMLEQAGYVELQGRVGTQRHNPTNTNAYRFRVTDGGNWSIIKSDTTPTHTTLASGSATALGTGKWHTLALAFDGATITASIDGTNVGSTTDSTHRAGQVGIAASKYINVQYDNLAITSITHEDLSGTYRILNQHSGLALEVAGGSAANGGLVDQSAYTAAKHQEWKVVAAGGGFYTLVNLHSGKVLDVPRSSTARGTQLHQWTGNGGVNQQWRLTPSGSGYTVTSPSNGLVADVTGASTADGAKVIQWSVTGGDNQQWRLVKIP